MQSARRRIGKQGLRTAVCASADQKNILRAQGAENNSVLFLRTSIAANFFSLSLPQYFLFSHLLPSLFLFLHKVPKSSLALATCSNRCPSISPRALANSTRETCSHFLWGETKIKYARGMAHTEDTHTHTSYVRLSGFHGLGGGEGGDEERDGNNNNDDIRRSYDG